MKKAEQKKMELQLKLAKAKGKIENRELLKLCVKKGAEVLKLCVKKGFEVFKLWMMLSS